jgi:hypothetical protein
MFGGEKVSLEAALAVSYSLARKSSRWIPNVGAAGGTFLMLRSNDVLRRDTLFDDFPPERETASSFSRLIRALPPGEVNLVARRRGSRTHP